MTEQEWLTSTDPAKMLEWATAQPGDRATRWNRSPVNYVVSDRKLRLFALACHRNTRLQSGEILDCIEACVDDPTKKLPPLWASYFDNPPVWVSGVISNYHSDKSEKEAALLREIVGNPFRPYSRLRTPDGRKIVLTVEDQNRYQTLAECWLTWKDRTVPRMAQRIYDERDWTAIPILADALEDAGCDDNDLLGHLHGQMPTADRSGWIDLPVPHVRGCWALDLIIGKE